MNEERIPLKVWKWRPKRNRKRGRPRKTWKENIEEAMQKRDITENAWQNKKQWRLDRNKRPSVVF